MSLVVRRFRSLLIALAVLALSATAVFAGHSALSAPAGQVASQSHDGDEQADEQEPPEVDEGDADEETEAPEAPEAPDATDPAAAGEHPDNHGKLVSEAAQAETPDGFDNHGAYVRTIAEDNHGHADPATKHAKNQKQH